MMRSVIFIVTVVLLTLHTHGTKPAGQGTGLGLSLSYDIIKAHGGELKVRTNERNGTVFIITLPIV